MLKLPATQLLPATGVDRLTTAGLDHSDRRAALPVLGAHGVTIRTLRASDAPTLFSLLTTGEVARFISPPPRSVQGFEKFVAWTHRQRAEGRYVCFGIVPEGQAHAVGLIQIRALDDSFGLAEWGFAIGSSFWGTGLFQSAARRTLDFVFSELPVQRLEARAVTKNGRGNGALRKLGASCEAVLRRSFRRDGVRADQKLWTILRGDWVRGHAVWSGRVH